MTAREDPRQRDRLVIFGSPRVSFTGVLLDAFLKELRGRDDIELLAVVETSRRPQPPPIVTSLGNHAARLVGSAFNPQFGNEVTVPRLYQVAQRHGVPVIVPSGRDINSAEFIASLRTEWRPTLALSLGCIQIFSSELLQSFEMAVNYHNGYLPDYRGLLATSWSMYRREQHTGYAYHVMDTGIDTGPILIRGKLPIPSDGTSSRVRLQKSRQAAADAPAVLDHMVRRSPGQHQQETGSYFSGRDHQRITAISDPGQLSAAELFHRLRCFEVLNMRIRDRIYEVTALRDGTQGLSFRTSDGRDLSVHRCLFLPPWLYRLYRRLRPERPHPAPS